MKKTIAIALLTAVFVAPSVLVFAQPSGHYVPGVEGLKGSTLPPPGVYARDYNVFYFADQVNDSHGNKIGAADASAFVYANVPRVLWITDKQVLGGFIGVDALIPFKYTSLEYNQPPPTGGKFDESTFGVGDLFVETTLSWHPKQFDFAFAYGVWAPTGNFSDTNPTRPGQGFWTQMLTAGITWYPDQEKKWSVSALSRYEFNTEQEDTHITPGQDYTLEWGVGYAVKKTVDVGVAGYWQIQTTDDSGSGSSNNNDQVVGIGPEISAVCPKMGVIFSLRYLYEVLAEDRLQGQTICLTLTKRL